MLTSFVNTCFGALDPPRDHRPVFLQFETRGPGVGAGIPDERDRNRVSVSKLFVTVSFLKVRVRARARKEGAIRSLLSGVRIQPLLMRVC
jgi:hypothetical protein